MRETWELGNTELFVWVRGKEIHTAVLLLLAVSTDTHRCKSRERENASAVCFMRGLCQQKVWLQSYSFWLRFVGPEDSRVKGNQGTWRNSSTKMKTLLSFTQSHAVSNPYAIFFSHWNKRIIFKRCHIVFCMTVDHICQKRNNEWHSYYVIYNLLHTYL